jgi:uncharacterized membrane protein YpjA
MDDARKVALAKERVEAMTGFYIHFGIYVAVIALLFGVNAWSGDDWWAQWVLVGSGIGVAVHALAVFGQAPRAFRRWQVRKIKALVDQM